jgi:hypothetical protein
MASAGVPPQSASPWSSSSSSLSAREKSLLGWGSDTESPERVTMEREVKARRDPLLPPLCWECPSPPAEPLSRTTFAARAFSMAAASNSFAILLRSDCTQLNHRHSKVFSTHTHTLIVYQGGIYSVFSGPTHLSRVISTRQWASILATCGQMLMRETNMRSLISSLVGFLITVMRACGRDRWCRQGVSVTSQGRPP